MAKASQATLVFGFWQATIPDGAIRAPMDLSNECWSNPDTQG